MDETTRESRRRGSYITDTLTRSRRQRPPGEEHPAQVRAGGAHPGLPLQGDEAEE